MLTEKRLKVFFVKQASALDFVVNVAQMLLNHVINHRRSDAGYCEASKNGFEVVNLLLLASHDLKVLQRCTRADLAPPLADHPAS